MNLYKSKTYIKDLENAIADSIGIDQLIGKKVLITGAAGTIGSFLVDLLLQYNDIYHAGIIVYAANLSLSRLETRFKKKKTEQLIFVEHNILQPFMFDFEVDYIIHAAGNAFPAAFNSDPVGTIIGNVDGTWRLLEYGRTHGVSRFLYISSGEVYGQGDITMDSFDETYSGYVDPLSPRSSYPNSKRAAETLCVSYYKQYGVETVIARPCHTYGPWITEKDNRANAQFIKNVMNGEDIVLKSDGNQMRSYCYIADCASAMLTICINGKSGEAYNIANPNARVTIARFAEITAELAGRKVIFANSNEMEENERTPINKQVLNSRKLESLGWKGRYTVDIGLDHLLAILQEK